MRAALNIAATTGAAVRHAPPRASRKPVTAEQVRALLRLREIGALSRWRTRNGADLLEPNSFIRVIIDALARVSDVSKRCVSVSDIRALLPRDEVEINIDDDGLRDLISSAPLGHNMLPASDAGQLVELVEVERVEIEAEGLVIQTLHPRDEDACARRARREARRREKTRLRNIKLRESRRNTRVNSVTLKVATSLANVANQHDASIDMKAASRAVATSDETQAGRVHAAIVAGCASVAEIVTNTNLDHRVVRPLLTRLLKARRIERAGRGRYRARAP